MEQFQRNCNSKPVSGRKWNEMDKEMGDEDEASSWEHQALLPVIEGAEVIHSRHQNSRNFRKDKKQAGSTQEDKISTLAEPKNQSEKCQ